MTRVSGFVCKDCGEPFSMDKSEIEFYENKGWEQPKRCRECRKKRREARIELHSNPQGDNVQYKRYLEGVWDPRD
jgi:DNA replicative helicase MCM subunit Mcm2 (Cdc46/Mcm family)